MGKAISSKCICGPYGMHVFQQHVYLIFGCVTLFYGLYIALLIETLPLRFCQGIVHLVRHSFDITSIALPNSMYISVDVG